MIPPGRLTGGSTANAAGARTTQTKIVIPLHCRVFIFQVIGKFSDTLNVEIYLVRHGIAEEAHTAERDAERRLTPEGLAKTTLVAQAFRKRVNSLDLILHSPFLRAVETAEIFGREFPGTRRQVADGFTPADEPAEAVGRLGAFANLSRVMLVSHEPFLSGLASYLLTGSEHRASLPFKKAGICAMEWGGAGGSSLLYLIPPRILIP
jgi:phosphohistidine phosphatase